MARTYVKQKIQSNKELFDSLVKNAIDFVDSSIDDLDVRPKNAIVDFYTSIELFLKARLMLEHWTLILEEPGKGNIQSFSIGDFKSIYLEGAVKRLKSILAINISDTILDNFKELGEHRNQIVHFSHTEYSTLEANKAGVVAQQWSSWHHLYKLLTDDWKEQFLDHQDEFGRVHKRMLTQNEFLKVRFTEFSKQLEILKHKGIKVVTCNQCDFEAGQVTATLEWGDEYECLVCESNGLALALITDTLDCPRCEVPFQFFNSKLKCCPTCELEINTNQLIKLCHEVYTSGDGYCDEGSGIVAGCHQCKHSPDSVFYIQGQWSCVSCFDRGWTATDCPNCDEYVTGDMDRIKYFACYKCEEQQTRYILNRSL